MLRWPIELGRDGPIWVDDILTLSAIVHYEAAPHDLKFLSNMGFPVVAVQLIIGHLMIGDIIFMALDNLASMVAIVQEPLRLLGWSSAVAVVVVGISKQVLRSG